MSPSSAFSARRGLLRRPKVCKPPPPPPPPPPPALNVCDLIPDADSVEPGGDVSVTLFADQTGLAPGSDIPVVGSATCGDWDYPNPIRSDFAGDPSVWTAPFDPGTCTLCMVFTFPDLTTCESCIDIDVEEEEPEA